VLKIKDNSDTQVCDPQIVQHQSAFVISDSVDHFGIHDHPESFRGCRRKPNSTTNAFSYGFSTNPWPSVLKNLYGTADNLENFFFGQQLYTIRVHSCSLVVNHELESMSRS